MNRWVRKRKARGFTLVELLIVIVIIGILAGSMLLVFGSATDKAKATRIVSDMRNLKAAALMYYADTNDWPDSSDMLRDLEAYMDREEPGAGEYASYDIYRTTPSNVTSEGLYVVAEGFESGIGAKLEEIEEDEGSILVEDSGTDGKAYMIISR